MSNATQKHILIIKLGALGDVIIAEGLMRCIRAHHPHAHITLLTRPPYARLLQKAPHFNAIIIDNCPSSRHILKLYKLRRQLKQQKFDLVYNLQNNKRSRHYEKWLRPATINKTIIREKLGIKLNAKGQPQESIRDIYAEQIATAGVDISKGILPDLRWAAAPDAQVQAIMQAAQLKPNFVLLIAGSSARHPEKRWARYDELAQMLQAQNINCATAPGPDEIELCRTIPAAMLLDNGKPLSFEQMIGLAPYCAYVVGNDTGPTHLMAAANTHGLALFNTQNTTATQTGIDQFYDIISVDDFAELHTTQIYAQVMAAYSKAV